MSTSKFHNLPAWVGFVWHSVVFCFLFFPQVSTLWSFLLPLLMLNSKIYHLFLTRAKDKQESLYFMGFSRQEMGLGIFEVYVPHQMSF